MLNRFITNLRQPPHRIRVRHEPCDDIMHRAGVFEGHFEFERSYVEDGGKDLAQLAVHDGVEFIEVALVVAYGPCHIAVVVAEVLVGCFDEVGDFVVDVEWGVVCVLDVGVRVRGEYKGVLHVPKRVGGGARKRRHC